MTPPMVDPHTSIPAIGWAASPDHWTDSAHPTGADIIIPAAQDIAVSMPSAMLDEARLVAAFSASTAGLAYVAAPADSVASASGADTIAAQNHHVLPYGAGIPSFIAGANGLLLQLDAMGAPSDPGVIDLGPGDLSAGDLRTGALAFATLSFPGLSFTPAADLTAGAAPDFVLGAPIDLPASGGASILLSDDTQVTFTTFDWLG